MMVTIRDIANKINLSPATISRALNGDTNISVQTRERVEELAREMNYVGTQKRSSKYLVGIICPEIISKNYSCLVESISENLERKGYLSTVMITHLDSKNEKKHLERLFDLKVAGIILVMYNDSESIETLKEFRDKCNIPLLQIANFQEYQEFDSIMISNKMAAKMAVDHLYQMGHRQIAVLSDNAAKNRMEAVITRMRELDITPSKSMVVIIDNCRFEEAGYDGARIISAQIEPPSAVITTYDYLAIGFLRGCKELNIKVPEKISLISIDDISTSRYTHIALTSVSMPNYDMGRIASRIMISRIKNIGKNTAIQHVSLDPILMIRESVAKLLVEPK